MKNIVFDICAFPLFLVVLWTCYARKMTHGHANRVFVAMNWLSLICVLADIAMEFTVYPLPLSPARVVGATLLSFLYKLLRNAQLVIYIVYIIAVTHTEYLLRPRRNRMLLWLPNALVFALLLLNFFTHDVFSVTAQEGYTRGPLLSVFYLVALLYGLVGAGYCIHCRRYLAVGKWVALVSVYALTFLAVGVELVRPELLVEMFSTSVGITMILLLVMRPEETMDAEVGLQNWKSYKTDLANIVKISQPTQILVIQNLNADQLRSYLGEDRYNRLLIEAAGEIRALARGTGPHVNAELYIERPGAFYLTIDDETYDLESRLSAFLSRVEERLGRYVDCTVRFHLKLCLIRFPEDLTKMDDILSLGHKFPQLGPVDQTVFHASALVSSHNYAIVNHIDKILTRALAENRFKMYYQPIYDIRTGRFDSAEALIRLHDPVYGTIPPGDFIPYAESNSLILPIGEFVLEDVFRFISQHDLDALGLSYIEINLSVAQVLQSDLTQQIQRLQKKYGIRPNQVSFEITETLYDSISDVMDRNVRTLRNMGYGFALDDYGVGYSNIQRISRLPLDIVKIDKSLVDDMFTEDGQVILSNTIHMMQGIHKRLVVEGVETKEANDALTELSCDYIQGYYYSRPLPEDAFVAFLKEHNAVA